MLKVGGSVALFKAFPPSASILSQLSPWKWQTSKYHTSGPLFLGSERVKQKALPNSPPHVNVKVSLDLGDWSPFYRFEHIIIARAIQRLKIYQTVFTCGFITPGAVIGVHFGYGDAWTFSLALATSFLACAMLYIMGTMSSRVIGFLYTHKTNPNLMRIARLSFFGNRLDSVVPINYFVPISELPDTLGDMYIILRPTEQAAAPELTYLPHVFRDKYYLSLKYGTILDENAFRRAFGNPF